MSISRPPWNLEQVKNLTKRQKVGHAYTCPNHSDTSLLPTAIGWVCPLDLCDYMQTWAHAIDVDGTNFELRGTI